MQFDNAQGGWVISAEFGDCIEDVHRDTVIQKLLNGGWVHFTGFNVTEPEHLGFTATFGECGAPREVHYPEGGEGLGYHSEDAYNPYRPDAIWFLCKNPGTNGGAPTCVVDGARIFEALSPRSQEFAVDNSLRFDRHWSFEAWSGVAADASREQVGWLVDELPGMSHQFLQDGTLWTTSQRSMVERTEEGRWAFSNTMLQAVTEQSFYGMALSDGSAVPSEFVDEVQAVALSEEVAITWTTGDVAVIDNRRMMHRRPDYSGIGRDLLVLHCDEMLGSRLPDDNNLLSAGIKRLVQSDVEAPVGVGLVADAG